MSREITREHQPAATAEVAAELAERQAALSSRPSEAPSPGDIYLSRRTADFPVEWMVVEEAENGHVLVVPLDEHPYVGSHDLELPSQSLGGAGVLRCDLDAWIDGSELEPGLRTGTLSEAEVESVQHKRHAIEAGTVTASLLEEEVDGDPEYRRWCGDTLGDALAALTGAERAASEANDFEVAEAPPVANDFKVAEAPSVGGGRWWPYLAAASVLLAVGLPLGWQLHRLNQQLGSERTRIAELEREHQAQQERLEAAEAGRQASSEQVGILEAALRKAQGASDRALTEQIESLEARLRRSLDTNVVVSVPSFVLGKQSRVRGGQGEARVIDVGAAPRLILSLEVVDPEPYERYRLRIVEQASGEEIWSNDQLVKLDGRWLRLDFPADLFEPTEYGLLIDGIGSGEPVALEERYEVKIQR